MSRGGGIGLGEMFQDHLSPGLPGILCHRWRICEAVGNEESEVSVFMEVEVLKEKRQWSRPQITEMEVKMQTQASYVTYYKQYGTGDGLNTEDAKWYTGPK